MLSSPLELVSPPRCAGCRRPGSRLCATCRGGLRPGGGETPPGVDRLVVACAYEGPARALVLALKVGGDRSAAAPLIDLLATAVGSSGLAATALTWVPGRRRDMRRRSFDHAELLGRGLARRLALPARPLLRRGAARPDQAALTRPDRWANLDGAFLAAPISGRIVIVDDLVTTGATASACAGALRAAGAEKIEVVAVCKTLLGG